MTEVFAVHPETLVKDLKPCGVDFSPVIERLDQLYEFFSVYSDVSPLTETVWIITKERLRCMGVDLKKFCFWPAGVLMECHREDTLVLGGVWMASRAKAGVNKFPKGWGKECPGIPVVVKIFKSDYTRVDDVTRVPLEISVGTKWGEMGLGPKVHMSAFRVHRFGVSAGGTSICTLMQVVDFAGVDLFNHRGNNHDIWQLLGIIEGLCEQVVAMDELGYTHGDIKTENVCITADRKALLIDFGMAGPRAREFCGFNGAHMISGTVFVMPPEKKFWGACDCAYPREAEESWAVGLIIFELIFSNRRFRLHPWDMIRPKTLEDVKEVCALVVLGRIMVDCLNKNPTKRAPPRDIIERLASLRNVLSRLDRTKIIFSNPLDATWGIKVWGEEFEDTVELKFETVVVQKLCNMMVMYISENSLPVGWEQ